MPTVSATGSAGWSIPGCLGTVWVTGAAGVTGQSGPWAGAGWSQAVGTSGQRAAGTPAGQHTGIAGPWGRCPPADSDPAESEPQLSLSFPSLQRDGEQAPAERRGLSATRTPVGPRDRKVFSLWSPSAPSLRQVQVQISGRPGLAKGDMPPDSQSWQGGQCLQRQGSPRQACLVGEAGASGYGEANSLQALKGCQGSWHPEVCKARFQSHWRACVLLGTEGGWAEYGPGLLAAQIKTFVSVHFPHFPRVLTDQDLLLQSEKYVVFGCWP